MSLTSTWTFFRRLALRAPVPGSCHRPSHPPCRTASACRNFSAQHSVFFPLCFFFHIPVARGPQLRSAPLALPSVRDATHCVIFARTFNSQLRDHIHLISTSPGLCTSAPPPSPQPSSRGIVGRRLRQLRCCVADFPHSASNSLPSCCVVRVCLFSVGRPS